MIVSTFNRAAYLAESLESIFAQTVAPKQVIVINDGSTDDTLGVLQPFLRRVEYLETPNQGKPAALNLALPRVTGECVWIMDDDDVALPEALLLHLSILQQRPDVAWTYSSYIKSVSNPAGRISPICEVPLPTFAADEFSLRLMEECFLVHPTIVVRTECYRELGPFDTSLVRCQDYDMALRLARVHQPARLNGPTIYRRYHSGPRGSASDQFEAAHAIAKWLEYMRPIFRKLYSDLPLAVYLPGCLQTQIDNAILQRRAYLQRMVVMGKKGLYREMLADLRAVLATSSAKSPLSSAECEMLQRLAGATSGDPLLSAPDILDSLRSVCRGPLGSAIRREICRAFAWRANHARGKHEYRETVDLIRAVCKLCGSAELLRLAFLPAVRHTPCL